MSKVKNILLIIIYLVSRLLLINPSPVFFDSQEYIKLFSHPDFLSALALGHAPPHVGYVLFGWPIYHLFHSLTAVLVFQVFLSLITIMAFIKIIKVISGSSRIALLSGVIVSLLPLTWITSVTFMMELAYVSFYIFSLYFLVKNRLLLSALFFSLALLTHPLVLFWLPLYIYLSYSFYKQRITINYLITLITIYIMLSCFNILNISHVSHTSFWTEFIRMYFSKFHEHAVLTFSLTGLLIALRNFLIPLVFNNSVLLVLFVPFVLFQKKQYFWLSFLWLIPAAFTNQWWDSLLNGRHAIISGFGLAFIAAVFLSKHRFLSAVFLTYLIAFSIPAVYLIKQPIPYIQEAQSISSLPKNSLLVISHFAMPQDEETFPGKLLSVNYPLTSTLEIKNTIDTFLKNNKPVFVTSTALSEPYGLYSGPYLHNLTLSYLHPFELQSRNFPYTLEVYKTISSSDNLIIYQITSSVPSAYSAIPRLNKSSRLINSHDLLIILWNPKPLFVKARFDRAARREGVGGDF